MDGRWWNTPITITAFPFPGPDTRPEFAKPAIYWTPVIAPGSLMFYKGTQTFPQWDGNALLGGMGDHVAQTASSWTAMAAPKPLSAGMWASASAMWKKAPMVRCGYSKTPIPAR